MRIFVPGEAAVRTDDSVTAEKPVPQPAEPIGKQAHPDKKSHVGRALEIGNPVSLIPTSRASTDAGVDLHTQGSRSATGGTPGDPGF